MSQTALKSQVEPSGLDAEIKEKLENYYDGYYRDALGLPDYKAYTQRRLNEEDREFPRIARLKDMSPVWGGRVLIVGTGTGSVLPAFKEAGFDEIWGCEPYDPALEITRMKVKQLGLDDEKFNGDMCEKLSFEDDFFDVIYCFTVIEHVRSPKKCLEEMVRVAKRPGAIYITTNNWNYPYEGHYKIHGPTFLGKTVFKWILKAMKRPTQYLEDDIIFLTPYKMFHALKGIKDIDVMSIVDFGHVKRAKPGSFLGWCKKAVLSVFEDIFLIHKNMDFIIVKHSTRLEEQPQQERD